MFVPTHLADIFEEAANPHLKHGIWIECAFPKVVDNLVERTKIRHKHIPSCTDWDHGAGTLGTLQMVESCIGDPEPFGIVHPYKISNGLETYSRAYHIVNDNEM